jgi:hypothetical protein
MKQIVGAFALALLLGTAAAQTAPAPPPPQQPQTSSVPPEVPPPANPADVKSIDAILAAVYDVISGPAGQKRDWNRFRSLFVPGARLIPTVPKKEGGYTTRVLSPEDYATRAGTMFAKEGFFEKEVARRMEQWTHIAQVFSTYESRHAPGEKPFARGINSFQLMNDGQRWWVVTIFWEAEDKDNPLPEHMLTSPKP